MFIPFSPELQFYLSVTQCILYFRKAMISPCNIFTPLGQAAQDQRVGDVSLNLCILLQQMIPCLLQKYYNLFWQNFSVNTYTMTHGF